MIIKAFILFCFALYLFPNTKLFSQSPKPPEAFLDYAETFKGVPVEVKVLHNDWGEEGHELQVVYSSGSVKGFSINTDSSVIYYPYLPEPIHFLFFTGTDTIFYRIRDIENNLLSELATIIIEVTAFNYIASLTTLAINNHNITLNSTGNYFWDFYNSNQSLAHVPTGNSTFTLKDSHLIMCGKSDESNNLLTLQDGFGITWEGSDYMPGPYIAISDSPQTEFERWNRQWKINKEEIINHIYNWNNPNYEIPESILNWPGNGDDQLGQAYKLAQFIDINNDGTYDPGFGDYPLIKGDQAVFMLYNDYTSAQVNSGAYPLGVEVHHTAFEFDCPNDSAFHNTFFANYKIINRSGIDIFDYYAAIYTQFQIGNPTDNYVGCDTNLNCYFSYNDSIDDNYAYYPVYEYYPPAQGVCFLNANMNSFIANYYMFNPTTSYLIQGKWDYYTPITYGGNGHGGTEVTSYLYSGDPSNPEEWSNIQTMPNEYTFGGCIGSSGPYDFQAGDTIELDIAYVFARDYGGTNLTSVSLLKERIAKLKWFYDNDTTPCGTPWSGEKKYIPKKNRLTILPNPEKNDLKVNLKEKTDAGYFIYSATGKLVKFGYLVNSGKINVSELPSGFYIMKVVLKDELFSAKFIKCDF